MSRALLLLALGFVTAIIGFGQALFPAFPQLIPAVITGSKILAIPLLVAGILLLIGALNDRRRFHR